MPTREALPHNIWQAMAGDARPLAAISYPEWKAYYSREEAEESLSAALILYARR